jgi:predicted nucleic acid-binding protein
MTLVLDDSATAAWLHPEEVTPALVGLFNEIADSYVWVPNLWHLEIANIFHMRVLKGKYPARERDEYLAAVAKLRVRVNEDTSLFAWQKTLELAKSHRLTLYDAAYLELAIRRDVPLATLDRDLRAAATREGVPLLGL